MMRRAWRVSKRSHLSSTREIYVPLIQSCSAGYHHTVQHSIGNHEASPKNRWLHLAIGASGGAACGGIAAIGLGLGQPSDDRLASVSSGSGQLGMVAVPVPPVSNVKAPSWVSVLSSQPGIIAALSIDKSNPHESSLSADHWFSSLVKHLHVHNLSMLYNSESQQIFSVLTLGKDVCGYPSIVHGGLTAATFDETFGGLLFALKNQGKLPFWGPAFTAQLDITYISRISADRTILCTAEVESIDGRKVWMRAVMSDGPQGKVYATARALFVAPKPHRLLRDIAKMVVSRSWLGGSDSTA